MSDSADDVEILKERLSEGPSEEFLEQVASTVVDEMAESFPELSLKTRPIAEALEEFREMKIEDIGSERQYNRKLDYLRAYLLDVVDGQTTDDISSEDVKRYKKWRKYESLNREKPLSKNTLRDDMYLFREFIQYLTEHRMAPVRFEKCIQIPEVDYAAGEGVDKKKLDPEIAKASRNYLRKYQYANVEHVTMELLFETGGRKGGLVGRNLSHFDPGEGTLQFKHRVETPLKKEENSEREITLYGKVPEIIQDYIADKRPAETDEEGQSPLLTKGDQRISPSTLQKISYKWTRPCMVGLDCPHDRDPENCEAAQKNNSAYKCPSSRAPHHIRKGYITDQKNRGVPGDAIEHRCDVSNRIQDLHYDLPDDTEERERYEDEFRNADEDPDSGYNHE
jgi:hypothetical protein